MNRNGRNHLQQQRSRIGRRAGSTEAVEFFNVLTSPALLKMTESLLPTLAEVAAAAPKMATNTAFNTHIETLSIERTSHLCFARLPGFHVLTSPTGTGRHDPSESQRRVGSMLSSRTQEFAPRSNDDGWHAPAIRPTGPLTPTLGPVRRIVVAPTGADHSRDWSRRPPGNWPRSTRVERLPARYSSASGQTLLTDAAGS